MITANEFLEKRASLASFLGLARKNKNNIIQSSTSLNKAIGKKTKQKDNRYDRGNESRLSGIRRNIPNRHNNKGELFNTPIEEGKGIFSTLKDGFSGKYKYEYKLPKKRDHWSYYNG